MNSLHNYDELTRRNVMKQLAYGSLGVSMAGSLASPSLEAASMPGTRVPTAKHVIYLYMNGAMSQLDTFDAKDNQELMGGSKAIHTNTDGAKMGNYLPMLASMSEKFAIIRSMQVDTGSHQQANYKAHTSYDMRPDILHPCFGSWVTKLTGKTNQTLPGTIRINGGSPTGAGFFESEHTPLIVRRPDQGIQYSQRSQTVKEHTFDKRLGLLEQLNQNYKNTHKTKRVNDYSYAYEAALKLMRSEDLKTFDISLEPDHVHQAYGKNSFGKGCLLARRLVEQKARFIEVNFGGWDHHFNMYESFPEKAQQLDQAMGALLIDLEQRGLLHETLVVLTTEFGRTPVVTDSRKGRDHYPIAFSSVLAGGGIKGGQVYGVTDEECKNVLENPVRHKDLNATIGYALGLPMTKILYSNSGRPFTAADKGTPLLSLFERSQNV